MLRVGFTTKYSPLVVDYEHILISYRVCYLFLILKCLKVTYPTLQINCFVTKFKLNTSIKYSYILGRLLNKTPKDFCVQSYVIWENVILVFHVPLTWVFKFKVSPSILRNCNFKVSQTRVYSPLICASYEVLIARAMP